MSDKNQLRCGNCGEKTFELYTSDKQEIIAKCNECESSTIINIKARINFDWGVESKGVLAVF